MPKSQSSSIADSEQATPSANPSCHICGGSTSDEVCSSSEVESHVRFLQQFHRRRRRESAAGDLSDRADFTQSYVTAIVTCRGCGLLYRDQRPTAEAVTDTYSQERYGHEHLRSEFVLQRQWATSKVRTLARHLPVRPGITPRIVEVGSFVGGFLAVGREQGWNMLGVDPGQEVAGFCHEQGLNVLCGTLIEAQVPTHTFDAVTIWNTFDQLPHPDATLAAARRMLHDHGILVIRVPNGACFHRMMSWWKRSSEPLKGWLSLALAWNNLLGFPYLYGYTVRTLDELLSRHGFAPVAVYPDTLMTLANQDFALWAKWEERAVKWSCRAAANVDALWNGGDQTLAPWLDIYYRVTQAVPDTTLTVSRESPERRPPG
jgi:2-polyprenyl-3-methyl-5-hydroxy-6-metoxy-1,4-benzoquinol methylase